MFQKRAFSYQAAIRWLACNDDSGWIAEDDSPASVAAAFVADSYTRKDSEVRADLQKYLDKV